MLLSVFCLLSGVAAATLACVNSSAFETLRWLWLLPCGFLGGCLGALLLFCLMVLIMGLAVDMKKTQETDNRFYRWVLHQLIFVGIPLLGVRFHTQGLEKTPEVDRCMVVCNHLFELDPVFLLKVFPKKKLAFISKREVDDMFLVGPFLHKIMGQPINRENDREALKTILNCIRLLQEDRNSVAVFPEGYIKTDRLLRRFRSGVFKIAQRTKVPIVVCTLRNTHKIIHNFLRLKKTDVHLHLVGVIGPECWEGATTVEIAEKAYRMMADDLGEALVYQSENG